MTEQIEVPGEPTPADKVRRKRHPNRRSINVDRDLKERFKAIAQTFEFTHEVAFERMLEVMEAYIDRGFKEADEDDGLPKVSPENFRRISTQALSAEEPFNDILSRVISLAANLSKFGLNLSELRPEEAVIIAISLEQLAWMRLRQKSPDETNEHIVGRMCDGIENADNIIKEEHAKYQQLVKKYNSLVKG